MLRREDLYAFQKRASDFISSKESCALWVDCGLGKTISTLTATVDLMNANRVQRALVIAPLRVARRVWTDEVKRWAHTTGLSISTCTSGDQKMTAAESLTMRLQMLRAGSDITTINREQVPWLESLFIDGKKQIRRWPWDLVIVDESSSFKSQSSQRWKSLKRLRRLFSRLVQLTGTPTPNGYEDLWSQAYLLDSGARLGESESKYHANYFNEASAYEYRKLSLKPGAEQQIQAALANVVLTMRAEDYLDLPPVKYNAIRVTLPAAARDKYKRLERDYILETYGNRRVTAVNAGVCQGKLLQLANGAIYVNDHGQYETLHTAKLEALAETLEGLFGPVMIGYGFRADRERIGALLTRFCGKTKKWSFLETNKQFDAFAAGDIDYGIIHPGSAGHGLNDLHLSGSENLVWFGLTNNLEFYTQLNARLTGGHRRMGKNIVVHHLLMSDTVDEKQLALLTRKDATQDDLTRNMANIAKRIH